MAPGGAKNAATRSPGWPGASHAAEDAQAAVRQGGLLLEVARGDGVAEQLVRRPATGGRVGEHVVDGEQPALGDVRGPAPVVGPRRLRAVPAVDEEQGQWARPVGGDGG